MHGRESEETRNNFARLRENILAEQGKKYWRSLEELADAPEFEQFVKEEFPQQADEFKDPTGRRRFLKIMGASLALAGVSSACVVQPEENIIPYVRQPEELIPGKPLFYATTMTMNGIASGLLVRSTEGRPTKIEGNPEHPANLGGTNIFAEGSLLTMYDPDRSKEVQYRGTPRSYDNFVTEIRNHLTATGGNGGSSIRFLTGTITSPSVIEQFKQILTQFPNARWYQYDAVGSDNAAAGARLAFGENVNTVYKFDQADRVLSLDSDFLTGYVVRYVKDFSEKRRITETKNDMNRLYVVETTPTITGAKADHRLTVKPSQMEGVARAIAAALGIGGANSTYTANGEWISAMVRDLQAFRGRSLVVVGERQPPIVHALGHLINSALGNVGTTLIYTAPLEADNGKTQIEGLRELVRDIDAGAVDTLVIAGTNPVYTAPADLSFNLDRLNKVRLRIHFGLFADETAQLSHWHVNQTHYLEEWSDARAYDGTISLAQPLIAPLHGGHSMADFLQVFNINGGITGNNSDALKGFWQKQNLNFKPAAIPAPRPNGEASNANQNQTGANSAQNANQTAGANGAQNGNAQTAPQNNGQTRQTNGGAAANGFDDLWRRFIHDGFIPNSALPAKTVTAKADFLNQPTQNAGSGAIEFIFAPDPSIHDGFFANNGWLQELPNPLTKLTWDNIALISPETAKRYGLNQDREYNPTSGAEEGTTFVNTKGGNLFADTINVKVNGLSINQPVPVWIMPGQPDDVITLYLGYGRKYAGRVGNGIGYNAYDVRTSNNMTYGFGEISAAGGRHETASTQTHFNMEGRDILRVFDYEIFEQNPAMGHQHDEYEKSLYPRYRYDDKEWKHRWGMVIDLNSCVGCNTCVVACQAENNIPVVGKEQVQRSREMHWMRIDTYFGGRSASDPDGPHFMPLLCQQCEQAPCEPVCPVHATVHSAEGLNDMVYNRCVGTRYCSNNCPYKVRRFNFLLYQDWNTPEYKLMRNTEVTVRSRGVMEKCTYCTQRIAAARIEAQKRDGGRVRDGEVMTACQSACPANAITFGDLNDQNSEVYKKRFANHRNYSLLNELNTQPRTTYLASLKNQNKEMPDYKERAAKAPAAEHSAGAH